MASSSRAVENNQKLFPPFARKLAQDNLETYSTFAGKLGAWLSSERAYYPAARPEIVKLLLTAHATLRRAVGAGPNLSSPFHVSSYIGHPMVVPYSRLLNTVHPHQCCFVEPELQAQIRYLLNTITESMSTPLDSSKSATSSDGHSILIEPLQLGSSPGSSYAHTSVLSPPVMARPAYTQTKSTDANESVSASVLSNIYSPVDVIQENIPALVPQYEPHVTSNSPSVLSPQESTNSTPVSKQAPYVSPTPLFPSSSQDTRNVITSHLLVPTPHAPSSSTLTGQDQGSSSTASPDVTTSSTAPIDVLERSLKPKKKRRKLALTSQILAKDLEELGRRRAIKQEEIEVTSAGSLVEANPLSDPDASDVKEKLPDNCPSVDLFDASASTDVSSSVVAIVPMPGAALYDRGASSERVEAQFASVVGDANAMDADSDFGVSTIRPLEFTASTAVSQLEPVTPGPVSSSLPQSPSCMSREIDSKAASHPIEGIECPILPSSNAARSSETAVNGRSQTSTPQPSRTRSPCEYDQPVFVPEQMKSTTPRASTPVNGSDSLFDADIGVNTAHASDSIPTRNDGTAEDLPNAIPPLVPAEQAKERKDARKLSSPERSTPPVSVAVPTRTIDYIPVSETQDSLNVFGSEMRVLAIQKGYTSRSKITIQFNIPEEQFGALSLWNDREKTMKDLKESLCLSLACYPLLEDTPEQMTIERLSALPSCWPTSGGLSMNVLYKDKREEFPLSPPFSLAPNGLVDVSQFLCVGQNVIQLNQRLNMSRYIFILRAHYPTRGQLEQIVQRHNKLQEWRSWLRHVSRPLDISLPMFS